MNKTVPSSELRIKQVKDVAALPIQQYNMRMIQEKRKSAQQSYHDKMNLGLTWTNTRRMKDSNNYSSLKQSTLFKDWV